MHNSKLLEFFDFSVIL